ncbi:MAG: transketolase family protein [Lachnospiraceae bacterium]|nr:transketolase family protein [Lachnospiraceae bacterium]
MSEMKKIPTRDSYGAALAEAAKDYPNLIVMDADLSCATKTEEFAKVCPERFFNAGIAEANMVCVAAGLAAAGMIPFVSSFAMFTAGRAFEQIRNSVAYPKLNVKIGATHAGISVGEDGASHQCIEDIALMRVLPNMTVLSPSDDIEARACVKAALDLDGPVYLRLGRAAVPVINGADYHFEIGKGQLLKEGKDVTIVATGLLVSICLEAAELLKNEGIDAEVINICSIKPLDEELILASAAKTGRVVTAEEHLIAGGLGGAVAEVLSAKLPTKLTRIGMEDRFGESAPAEALLEKFGFTPAAVCARVKEACR